MAHTFGHGHFGGCAPPAGQHHEGVVNANTLESGARERNQVGIYVNIFVCM